MRAGKNFARNFKCGRHYLTMKASRSKRCETDQALHELRAQLRLIDEAILLLERLEQARKTGDDGQQPESGAALSFQFRHRAPLLQRQS
jgi:hypothetical protein